MSEVSIALRRIVIHRAAKVCEYCGLSQEGQEATFHIDHGMPRVAGGETRVENLALACVSCSLRKAARQTAVDPHSARTYRYTIHAVMIGRRISSGMVSP